MKPRESEFFHQWRPNATGHAMPHPEQSQRLWVSTLLCHPGPCAPDKQGPHFLHLRTQNSLKTPKRGKGGSHFVSWNPISRKCRMTGTDDPDAAETVRETWLCSLDKPGHQTKRNPPRHLCCLQGAQDKAGRVSHTDWKTGERKRKRKGLGEGPPPTPMSEK